MTDVKCIPCGAVNLVADEMCKVCGAELIPLPSSHRLDADKRHPLTVTSIPPFSGVNGVLGPAFNLFFKNLWLITRIVFVIVAPFEIFKVLSIGDFDNDRQLTALTFVLSLVCKALIAPALIYALMRVLQTGVAPGVNESYRWGLSKLGKLSLCALMAWTLQALGYVALIIPGIILGLAFELVYPIAVLENHSPVETLQRSYNLTKGRRLNILFAGIVMAFAIGIISVPAAGASTYLLLNNITFWPLHAAIAIVTDIMEQATTVLSLVIYLSILRTLE